MTAATPLISPIAAQIWDMKYRFKRADGTPRDLTIEDSWRRVAEAAAEAEAPGLRAAQAARFFEAMEGFKFIPAGRILAGAGTGRSVTLFNCFVMGTIPDDMAGIFENLKEAALTMQRGGGIGYDFSTLRPHGAPVHGIGAVASGPLSFMDAWDAMCRTIMSAGHRRGAMMATLSASHPDIEAFIEAKRDPARLRMFNLSVLVSDIFMKAVEDDAEWPLVFGGTVHKTLKARALWALIMRSTYDSAEPGVIFIDRINSANNLNYCETIAATNPCVTAETWVMTSEGPRQVAALVGRPFTALVDGKAYATTAHGFFATGVKPVLRLHTSEGHALRLTADHRVRKVARRTRWALETAWVEAGGLRPGDEIMLHDHRSWTCWGDPSHAHNDANEGYLLGLLIGDGTLKSDKAVLGVWTSAAVANGDTSPCGGVAVMRAAEDAARALGTRADFAGWMRIPARNEWRLATGALKKLAERHGLAPGRKTITPEIESRSSAFYAAFLRGLFDADGSIQGAQAKGVSVRLSQSDEALLQAAQRMLARLGIASVLYRERRPAGHRLLPDGKGGNRLYPTLAQHELVVSGENIARFAQCVGFADSEKAAGLAITLSAYARALNRERFVATVDHIEEDGTETVFDVMVPEANAFDANGLYVHNCGEQPLPPYGACLLGSINLARLVENPFTDKAALDPAALDALTATAVRLLDNVIDISPFPLEAQRHEAQMKRRIGLGVTGLADALMLCGLRYGGAEAAARTEGWLARIERAAYRASAALAAEKGPFPLYDAEAFAENPRLLAFDEETRAAIAAHGLRNGLLTSIAPTGTISLLAGNVSSGIEPPFAFSYARRVLLPEGGAREEIVEDYAAALFHKTFGSETPLPDYFASAQTLSPAEHLIMQAAAQRHVDASISKTINIPESSSYEAFEGIYREAYRLGLKGCTTYRPNPVTGAVLSLTPPGEPKRLAAGAGGVVYMHEPLARPENLPGSTYKLRWPESDHALYITINDIVQDGRRRPFEIFINSKNMEHYAWTVALTRMISAVFRRGGDVSFVVDELKAVFDPRGGQWMEGHYVPSLLAAIGNVIERHLIETGFLAKPLALPPERQRAVMAAGGDPEEAARLRSCPRCFSPGLTRAENCDVCLACGYSRCG